MSTGLQSGETVGGYRIESLLGRGGMAAVYLAETELTEVELASPDLDQHEFDVPEGISAGSVAPAPDGSRVWVGNCGCPIEN